MALLEDIAKCTKCDNYVEKSDIANLNDTSDNYLCSSCGKEELAKKQKCLKP